MVALSHTHTHTHTHTFIYAYVYTLQYYSATKKNEILPFAATCMNLENIMLSEINQKDKYCIIYMWSLKNNTNKYIQNKQTH